MEERETACVSGIVTRASETLVRARTCVSPGTCECVQSMRGGSREGRRAACTVRVGGTEAENCIACSVISLPPGSRSFSLPPHCPSPPLSRRLSAASSPPPLSVPPESALTSILVLSSELLELGRKKATCANVHLSPTSADSDR